MILPHSYPLIDVYSNGNESMKKILKTMRKVVLKISKASMAQGVKCNKTIGCNHKRAGK